LDKRLGEKALTVHGKFKISKADKGETGEEQSQKRVHHFSLTSKGLFVKKSSWQGKQSIPHATVTFYADCVKICGDFARTLATK
jgi:hypothetical protein